MSTTISLPHEQVCVLGRADVRKDSVAFDWTNSGVYFHFVGNALTFEFDAPALGQHLYVQATIDGRRTRALVCEGQTVLRFDLSEGDHRVSCVRVNEILDGVPLVFRSITIDGESARLCEFPSLPDRRMLFIGDSITCGFGVLTDGLGNGFTTAEQDGAHTYAALTAAHFEAMAHFICISGRGIVRNCDNFQAPRIPEFFELTTVSHPLPWDHTQYQPDIVVINAGTNDTVGEEAPVSKDDFKEGVTTFIRRLRTYYPDAQILWVYGMMAGDMHEALSEAIASMENSAVHYRKLQSVWEFENEQGACCHPNLRSHYRCAGVLIDEVSRLTGWQK